MNTVERCLIPKYNELVYNAFWFRPNAKRCKRSSPKRNVTGVVRLKLYKGNIIVAGRKSPKSLYDPKLATMEGDESAKGRIRRGEHTIRTKRLDSSP